MPDEKIRIEQHSFMGGWWFAGWLFTRGNDKSSSTSTTSGAKPARASVDLGMAPHEVEAF